MNLRDAAQQALEALDTCDAAHPSDGGRQWYDDKLVEQAITTLRAALAEPQKQPEPVAWRYWHKNGDGTESEFVRFGREFPPYKHTLHPPVPLYTIPPQRQPVEVESLRAERDALLEALIALTEEAHLNMTGGRGDLIDDARAAIAKATGGDK